MNKISRFSGLWIRIVATIGLAIAFYYVSDRPTDACHFIFIMYVWPIQLLAFILDMCFTALYKRKMPKLYKIFSFMTGLILSIIAIYFGHFINAFFIFIVNLASIFALCIMEIENDYK